MGGLIAIHYAFKHQDQLKFLALSSPLLALAFPVPPVKAIAGRLLSSILPKFTLPTALDATAVSRDAAVVKAYQNDPLVHDLASTRWFTEMLAAIEGATNRAGELRLPVLVFHGGADKLTDPQGSRVFFQALTTKERHFKEWQGLYHEIFNETEQVQVLNELVAWIKPYLKS
jgi:lysophospholipase